VIIIDFDTKSNIDLESKYLSMLPVKVQIKFAKALLGVNKQAVNLAVLVVNSVLNSTFIVIQQYS
jgi:hypothetical protein